MTTILLLIIPLIILVLCIIGCRKSTAEDGFTALSSKSSKCIKGLTALLIVLHHISLKIEGGGFVYKQYAKMGYLLTAVFLFYSGYGLMWQYINKPDYEKKFYRKRLPKVLVPFLLILLIYYIVYVAFGTQFTFRRIVLSVLNGGFIPYSWFMICIIVFYIFFGLFMLISRKKPAVMMGLTLAFCVIWSAWFAYSGWGLNWYDSIHMLPFGMIIATYKEKIEIFVKKHFAVTAIITWVAFGVIYAAGFKVSTMLNSELIKYGVCVITSLLFMASILVLTVKIKFESKVFEKLGEFSLEMYLMQGLFIKIFFNTQFFLKKEFLFAYLCIIATIVAAVIVHLIDKLILKLMVKQ